MPQANPQNRFFPFEVVDDIQTDPRFVGRRGTGRDDDFFGIETIDRFDIHLVVADHLQISPQFQTVLDDIVGKRVVVVYH